jgi:hypothetical protein
MMEAVQTSETLVNSYQSTWRYNPEDSHRPKKSILRASHKLQIYHSGTHDVVYKLTTSAGVTEPFFFLCVYFDMLENFAMLEVPDEYTFQQVGYLSITGHQSLNP